MVNSYEELMGSQTDYSDHSEGPANTKMAGDVVPIRPSNLERDIAGARRQVENERSMRNIANQGSSAVNTNNLTVFK